VEYQVLAARHPLNRAGKVAIHKSDLIFRGAVPTLSWPGRRHLPARSRVRRLLWTQPTSRRFRDHWRAGAWTLHPPVDQRDAASARANVVARPACGPAGVLQAAEHRDS